MDRKVINFYPFYKFILLSSVKMANLANRNVSPKASHAMSTPFIYDKYVTGKDFLGRAEDAKILGNLLG